MRQVVSADRAGNGGKNYQSLNNLALLSALEADSFAAVMNNIILSNDGAFSLGINYTVRKSRPESCFQEITLSRYIIEPRLEGIEKLLPFRPSAMQIDPSFPRSILSWLLPRRVAELDGRAGLFQRGLPDFPPAKSIWF